jgi:hypothetical protein
MRSYLRPDKHREDMDFGCNHFVNGSLEFIQCGVLKLDYHVEVHRGCSGYV